MPKYTINLCEYPFDSSYENVLRFDTNQARDTYFTGKVYFTSNLENFNAGNLVRTAQRINYSQEDDLIRLLNAGYCYIENTETLSRLYYFITESVQESGRIITLSLLIDVFQTYYNDVTFSPCMIDRAHLNRFVQRYGDNENWYYDCGHDSPLYTDEGFHPPLRLLERRKLNINYIDPEGKTSHSREVNKWLNDHVRYWVYYFVESTELNAYMPNKVATSYKPIYNQNDGTLRPYMVFCYPVMEDTRYTMIVKYTYGDATPPTANTFEIGDIGMNSLQAYDEQHGEADLEGFRLNIKLSVRPPFENFPADMTSIFSIEQFGPPEHIEERFIIDAMHQGTMPYVIRLPGLLSAIQTDKKDLNGGHGVLVIEDQTFEEDKPVMTANLNGINLQYQFTKNEIKLNHDPVSQNPKLIGQSFKELRITSGTDYFAYDPLKIGERKIEFYYNEAINPGPSKSICKLKGIVSASFESVYASYNHALSGLIGNEDNTVIMGKNILKTYISNNKNWRNVFRQQIEYRKQQADLKYEQTATRLQFHKTAEAAWEHDIELENYVDNWHFANDNMYSAPAQIENMDGNPSLLAGLTDMRIYFEIWQAFGCDIKNCADFMWKNGFKYGRIQNPKDWDHTRKYFNYVKAFPEAIQGTISETVHQTFQKAFNSGVRFWHDPAKIKYDIENYERFLD